MRVYKGTVSGKGCRFGIVVSRYNEFITQKLVEGAIDTLIRHQTNEEDIEVVWVPGSFEIPAAASRLAKKGTFDAIICLGLLLRGATPHYDLISNQVARGISTLGMREKIPIAFGVVTAENIEQGIERAGTKRGNRGGDAALSAMEMVSLYRQMEK